MLGLRHQSTVPVEALHATLISRFEALSMIGVDRGTIYLPAPPNPATSRSLINGSRAGTRTRSHSSGPNPQNRSSNPSADFYNELTAQDTSERQHDAS